MKKLKYVLVFVLLFIVSSSNAQSSKDLSIFLGKLKTYVERHDITLAKPEMPTYNPDTIRPPMPSPDITGYMYDPVSRLRYYARFGKLLDPETGYSFHIQSGQIKLEDAAALRNIFKL